MPRPLFAFVVLLASGHAHSQQAVVPVGGEAAGSGGTVSYTVGQVAFNTLGSTTGTLTQGVQQPYEVLAMEVVVDAGQPMATAFPNPVSGMVHIRLNDPVDIGSYALFDALGEVVREDRLESRESPIAMDGLANATYTLLLYAGSKPIGTFRIIKH